MLFLLVTWQVAAGGPLRELDERAGRGLARPHGPSPVAELLADLGNAQVALCVLGAAVCRSAWRARRGGRAAAPPGAVAAPPGGASRWWLPPLAAALAMAAVPLLVVPLKLWLARPGPLGPAPGYGWYPSGHAATAAVAYGAAVLLLRPQIRRADLRRAAAAGAVVLNLAVGAGLVRRGYHWPLDVVGSWCLGGLVLWCLVRLAVPGPPGRGGAGRRTAGGTGRRGRRG